MKEYTGDESASVIMLDETSGKAEVTGDKIRADGWYGNSDGFQTVSIYVSNFRGKIFFEGTLKNNPSESDWFTVLLNDEIDILKYPRIENKPTGIFYGDTRTEFFNIYGNFTYLRVKMIRDHLKPLPNDIIDITRYGTVSRVLLNR